MSPAIPGTITVQRNAMATGFSMTIADRDERYARQAAAEAWRELEHLEQLLSRFVTFSDVARIGRCMADNWLVLEPETLDCLRLALRIESDTKGAFNIAYRHRPPRSAATLLQLNDTPPSVLVSDSFVTLDLGGIGKGFALDRMAAVLRDWDLSSFLLRASASTILAGAPPSGKLGWPVQFGPPEDRQHLVLRHAAISGSGTAVKGNHILNPSSGLPACHFQMTWAGMPTAAEADALSTAFMVMSEQAIPKFCRRHPDCLAYVRRRNECRVRGQTAANHTAANHTVYR